MPESRGAGPAWKTEHGIPFPVMVGSAGTPHEPVALTRKVIGSIQQSGTILVDPEGIIRHAHGATLPVNGYDKKGIVTAVRSIHSRTGP